MSEPLNTETHLVGLVNRNTEMIREAYNQQRKLYEETQEMVVAQNASIATLTAQVAALQKQVVLASLAGRGSEATV